MTVKECIDFVNDVKPHAFAPYTLLVWLGEIESRVAAEIFRMAPAELEQFRYTSETQNHGLLLDPPWDELYVAFLIAKVDSKNGEFNRLSTAAQAFNRKWNELSAYMANLYEPANGYWFPELDYGVAIERLLT